MQTTPLDLGDADAIRAGVRRTYAAVARGENDGCCGTTSCGCSTGTAAPIDMIGVAYQGVEGYVADADLGLGCGVPTELASQVFGEWTRACARLCRERGIARPLCYAPRRARGVVLVRERADRPYTVLSVLGMGRGWEAGAPVDDRLVQRALPLAGRGIVAPAAVDRAA